MNQLTGELIDAAAATFGPLGPHAALYEEVKVTARDGVTLTTDIYHPAGQAAGPVILIRTPYLKANSNIEGIYWASHGYRAVIQDTRGASSHFAEAADGADTVAWIEQAPWFGDALFLHGRSYLGFTAWATAASRPASLRAISVQIYSADRVSAWYPGGTFGLDVALPWATLMNTAERETARDAQDSQALPAEHPEFVTSSPAFNHLPLEEADVALGGTVIPFYRERLRYGGDDPHWAPLNFSSLLTEIDVPVLLIGGWHDYHRRYLWQDYQRLASRPRGSARLVTGPWSHVSVDVRVATSETRRWFDRHLAPSTGPAPTAAAGASQEGVRLFVTPDRGWTESADWPPAGAAATTLYLQADRTITASPGSAAAADRYVYDPADPTPAVGLASFGADTATPPDNRALEARPDVLAYTSRPYEQAVTLAGSARARLFVNSTQPTADFFVRITDVHPDGASINIVDGITRLTVSPQLGGDQPVAVDVDLGPIAHQLSAGHALRVQVSSGAHPVYGRNPGGTEPYATTTTLHPASQQIHLGGSHASHITFDILHDQIDTTFDQPGQDQ